MKCGISILGSTGSIGRQTLDVAEKLKLRVCAMTANRNVKLAEAQVRRFRPEVVAMYDRAAAAELKVRLADTPVRVVAGEDGLCEAAVCPEADAVVTAVMGTVGLRPTLAAIYERKRIALANKETLVCAGRIVMETARENDAEIIPVDSEHSAIFQCLAGGRPFKTIILTASGGPFRGMNSSELAKVTVEEALRHPNWNMGPKITIDCATMMNKGLEFIEAMHLFHANPEQIRVLVHPQSIIHSMVEYPDHSVIAQMGAPDMRLPIEFALTYPQRGPAIAPALDLTQVGTLTFEQPDLQAFPCLGLAMEAAQMRGTACAVMNAANEAAVDLFLNKRIRFCEIYELVRSAVEALPTSDSSIDAVLEADREARQFVFGKV
jgi:1-deoxy-D-xylulose-5-phosphate reductoisomerase